MLLVIKVLIFIALIKLLVESENPLLCASIYAGMGIFFNLLAGVPFQPVLVGGAIAFGYSFVYFWLLDRFEGGTLWWVILIAGLAALIFLEGMIGSIG